MRAEPQEYVQHIMPEIDRIFRKSMREVIIRALLKFEPLMFAKYAQHIIHIILSLDEESERVRDMTMELLLNLKPQVLVPHRYELRHRLFAPLRGRMWLVRWRQLFWGERLLWWWGGRAWKPGSAQAAALANQFVCMQITSCLRSVHAWAHADHPRPRLEKCEE